MRIRDIIVALAIFVSGAASAEAQERAAWSARNRVQVEQTGGPHRAAAAQRGAEDFIAIVQQGRGHTSTVTQNGDDNTAIVRQYGQNNAATIAQSGSGNAACVFQVGRNTSAEIVQTGGQSVGVIQTPRGAREVPVEVCAGAGVGRGGVVVGNGTRSGGRGRR
jgi:hypothetical protein